MAWEKNSIVQVLILLPPLNLLDLRDNTLNLMILKSFLNFYENNRAVPEKTRQHAVFDT